MKGLRKGFQGGEMEGIERTKKKEEERRGNKAEALLNRNCDQSIHRSLFGVLRATVGYFLFLRCECDLCTLRGPLCYYVHIHLLHLSSTISFFFVKFNLNRSLVL